MKDWERKLISDIEKDKQSKKAYIKKHGKFNEFCWALEEAMRNLPEETVNNFLNKF